MINLAAIENQTKPMLSIITGNYHSLPAEFKKMYQTRKSDRNFEQALINKYLGQASEKAEGAAVRTDNMNEMFLTTTLHKTFAISFDITREAIEDNLYESDFPRTAESLKDAMLYTKNVVAADPFNNGTSANFALSDGKPLFSQTHPTAVGTYSNLGDIQFSIEGIEQHVIETQRMKDMSGLIRDFKPKHMVVGLDLSLTADRLLKTPLLPGTMLNDTNTVNRLNSIPGGYSVNKFLTDSTAYYTFTNASETAPCFVHYERTKLELSSYSDFRTTTVSHKALERYSFAALDPHGCYAYAA